MSKSKRLYRRYQLLLSGGQLTVVLSPLETAVKLWEHIKEQSGIIVFKRLDNKGVIVSDFVTDTKHIIGIDDIFPEEHVDLESIIKRKKVWEENQKKQHRKRL